MTAIEICNGKTSPRSFWLPLAGQPLSFGNLCRCYQSCYQVSILATICITSGTGQVGPHMRQNVVLRNALSSGVHGAEMYLRFGVSLFRRQMEPLYGLLVILRKALAVFVNLA